MILEALIYKKEDSLATWIEKLGDEVNDDWDAAKAGIQKVRKYVVDKIASLKPKIGISAGLDIDAEIRLILDDSVLKVIDRITFMLNSAIKDVGTEFQKLVK
jgi:hypothetical protein